MAEEKPAPGFGINIGGIHLTATVALLASVVGGFYTAVQWVTQVRERQDRNTEAVSDLGRKIDGLSQVLQAFNERYDSNDDSLHQQILDLQKEIGDMAQDYHSVQRLQNRYDRAFSTYQPQPKQPRRR